MKAMQIKPRLGTLHDHRAFYAWYLTQKRLARISGATPPDDAPTMDSGTVTMDDATRTMDSDE